MKEVVLIDSQAARVRRFREAVALYQDTFVPLRRLVQRTRLHSLELRAARPAALQKAAIIRSTPPPESGDVRLHVFPSGAEALKFLRRDPPYAWAPRPAVVFTDLYADDVDGVSFVQRLKDDPQLRDVPAVILCNGATSQEVRRAWEMGSNAVVDFPWDGDDSLAKVRDVLHFWLTEAATPP